MIELAIGVFFGAALGGIITWVVAHVYHQRSSSNAPDWAKPLIESLPDTPVPVERLIELYQDALEAGEFEVDPFSGYIVCPECGAPSSEFESWEDIDDRGDHYVGRRCGQCGYSLSFMET
jgi:hypothetical protein